MLCVKRVRIPRIVLILLGLLALLLSQEDVGRFENRTRITVKAIKLADDCALPKVDKILDIGGLTDILIPFCA